MMEREIIEYNIVWGENRTTLVQMVTMAIQNGFSPLGGAGFNQLSGTYFQAVVKYSYIHPA
jgi:hypothetical protein